MRRYTRQVVQCHELWNFLFGRETLPATANWLTIRRPCLWSVSFNDYFRKKIHKHSPLGQGALGVSPTVCFIFGRETLPATANWLTIRRPCLWSVSFNDYFRKKIHKHSPLGQGALGVSPTVCHSSSCKICEHGTTFALTRLL
jgi:hypothetical protein